MPNIYIHGYVNNVDLAKRFIMIFKYIERLSKITILEGNNINYFKLGVEWKEKKDLVSKYRHMFPMGELMVLINCYIYR